MISNLSIEFHIILFKKWENKITETFSHISNEYLSSAYCSSQIFIGWTKYLTYIT